jgi:hypothetical protein
MRSLRFIAVLALLSLTLAALVPGPAQAQPYSRGAPYYQTYYVYYPDTNYWQPYYVPMSSPPTFSSVAPYSYYQQWYYNPPLSRNWYYQRYDPVTGQITTGTVNSFRR